MRVSNKLGEKKCAGSMHVLEGWGYWLRPGSQTTSLVPSSLLTSMQHPFCRELGREHTLQPKSVLKRPASGMNSACCDQLRAEITWLKSPGMQSKAGQKWACLSSCMGSAKPAGQCPSGTKGGRKGARRGKTPNGAPGLRPCLCCRLLKWSVDMQRRETGSSRVQRDPEAGSQREA